MPKMKTNRAAAKRFKRTGTGLVVRAKAYKSHILTKRAKSVNGIFAKLRWSMPMIWVA